MITYILWAVAGFAVGGLIVAIVLMNIIGSTMLNILLRRGQD